MRLWALNEHGCRERWALTHPKEPGPKPRSLEEKRAAVQRSKEKSGRVQNIGLVPKGKSKIKRCKTCCIKVDIDKMDEHTVRCKGQKCPLCNRGYVDDSDIQHTVLWQRPAGNVGGGSRILPGILSAVRVFVMSRERRNALAVVAY